MTLTPPLNFSQLLRISSTARWVQSDLFEHVVKVQQKSTTVCAQTEMSHILVLLPVSCRVRTANFYVIFCKRVLQKLCGK